VISAICSGILSGVFGGSNYNIIGPTGALSGFLAIAVLGMDLVEGQASCLLMFAIMTGIAIYIAQFLNLQRYVNLFPESVNEGFTLGVSVILMVNQLNFAMGLTGIKRHESLIDNAIETFRHS
jgi:SulP family sulfate permease